MRPLGKQYCKLTKYCTRRRGRRGGGHVSGASGKRGERPGEDDDAGSSAYADADTPDADGPCDAFGTLTRPSALLRSASVPFSSRRALPGRAVQYVSVLLYCTVLHSSVQSAFHGTHHRQQTRLDKSPMNGIKPKPGHNARGGARLPATTQWTLAGG